MTYSTQSTSDWLRSLREEQAKNRPPQVLEELTIKGVAKYIKDNKCQNIITMAGAGISTSAGIPDFRSPKTGLYDNLEKYNLPNPQAIFDIDYFKQNPEPFYELAREIWPGKYKPTPCHYFIKMLDKKGVLLRHYTQNIDSLEFSAGLDTSKVVEAHGTFRSGHCVDCNEGYKHGWIKEKVFAGTTPKCNECNGNVKPDIVFFGEDLPDRFKECVEEDIEKCDLLIIMGTSLVVEPFASVTVRVPEITPRLYINLEKTGSEAAQPMMAMFGGGFKFDDKDNYRDVFWQGTCDSGCNTLVDLLGWSDEYSKMIKDNNVRIEKEIIAHKKGPALVKSGKPSMKSGIAIATPLSSATASGKSKFTKSTQSTGVSGTSTRVLDKTAGVSGKSAHVSSTSTGVPGTSTRVLDKTAGVSGKSAHVSSTSTGVSGTSTGVSGTSTGVSGTYTGVSGKSQPTT